MTGEVGEKPACVKTHLRNVVVIPEMVGSVIGIYNGKGEFDYFFLIDTFKPNVSSLQPDRDQA